MHMTQEDALRALYGLADRYYAKMLDQMPDGNTRTFGDVANSARILRRAARKLQRVSERECNGVPGADGFAKWDEADQKKADREREITENKVRKAIAGLFGEAAPIEVRFQHDPRGAAIQIFAKGAPEGASSLTTFY